MSSKLVEVVAFILRVGGNFKSSAFFLLALMLCCFAYGESSTSTNRAPDQPLTPAEMDNEMISAGFYSDLKSTKCFLVMCLTSGAPAKEVFGQRAEALNDFIKLRLKNNLSKIPIKSAAEFRTMKASERDGFTIYKVYVDTFGTQDYPIAVSVRLEVEASWQCKTYAVSRIGIFNRRDLAEEVKRAIAEDTEQFAVAFMKARGEF